MSYRMLLCGIAFTAVRRKNHRRKAKKEGKKKKSRLRRVAVFRLVCYNIRMEKILTDVHTHTKFSPDGISDIEDMLKTAFAKGAAYYGISEHFDYDYKVNGIRFSGGAEPIYTDPELYFPRARALQRAYAGRMEVLVGGEFGYTDNPAAIPLYKEILEKYRPDFVVNSVHSEGRFDYAEKGAFQADGGHVRDKREVYRGYFALVRKSIDAPYHFDIVGHLCYCTRYAPYEDKRAAVKEFSSEIDGILKRIIERDKILEVNSSNRGAQSEFLPDSDVLRRYYELGGRKVSFASDAHDVSRVLEKRETVVKALKEIGFTRITVPCRGEHIGVEI